MKMNFQPHYRMYFNVKVEECNYLSIQVHNLKMRNSHNSFMKIVDSMDTNILIKMKNLEKGSFLMKILTVMKKTKN